MKVAKTFWQLHNNVAPMLVPNVEYNQTSTVWQCCHNFVQLSAILVPTLDWPSLNIMIALQQFGINVGARHHHLTKLQHYCNTVQHCNNVVISLMPNVLFWPKCRNVVPHCANIGAKHCNPTKLHLLAQLMFFSIITHSSLMFYIFILFISKLTQRHHLKWFSKLEISSCYLPKRYDGFEFHCWNGK